MTNTIIEEGAETHINGFSKEFIESFIEWDDFPEEEESAPGILVTLRTALIFTAVCITCILAIPVVIVAAIPVLAYTTLDRLTHKR
jgi:hypothetical protein